MNEDPGRLRKLVSVLRQRQMIVALDQTLESRLHRIADHRQRTSSHLLGMIAALLAPLLEPQIDAGSANPEALGHTVGPLTSIARLKRTAAKVMGIGLGHRASPLNVPFLTLQTFMRSALALPKEVEHWSLTTIREKLVKIGAKVVAHSRYVTFQMAEVAVPRDLFRGILELIDRLRRPSPETA